MFWLHADLQTHLDRLEDFKRICSNTFEHLSQHGMHLYGAWETVVGPRNLIVDLWRFDSEEAMLRAFASMQALAAWQQFAREVPPTILEETVRSINPLPYCPEFRTLKTRAILYWQIRTKRESFPDWVEIRSQFVPMAEERGLVLAAAWTNALTAGPQGECTEAWFFADQNRVWEAMARLEQDEKIKKMLAEGRTLLVRDSTTLMRPTWYSPDYLP